MPLVFQYLIESRELQAASGFAPFHGLGNDTVRRAKWQCFRLGQKVSNFHCVDEPRVSVTEHNVSIHLQRCDDIAKDTGSIVDFFKEINNDILSPLRVAIIAREHSPGNGMERLGIALHQASFGTRHFGKIKILLLRHH